MNTTALLNSPPSLAENYWEAVVSYLQQGTLNPAAFASWIAPLKPLKIENNNFVLVAKDEHVKTTVNSRYLTKIVGAFKVVCGKDYYVNIILESEIENQKNVIEKKSPNLEGTNLKAKFVFDSFVSGKSNQFAYGASLAVAENPGVSYNPLFIHGNVGLGKTHLMHAIGNYVLQNNPDAKVLYTSTESLMNEFVNAIRRDKNQEFRDKYRKVDVLLVDDIQFLGDKEGIQEEFFHTFNALHSDSKQIILTSDKPPSELKSIEDRLRSRFASGLPVDITSPDFETRSAILLNKVESEGVDVEPEVIDFIAKNILSNIRELEGALNTVTARAKLTGSKCTLEFAQKALEDMVKQKERREVDVVYIQETVANYYNLTVDDIISKKRTANVTYARHVAMYLSRMILDKPLKDIGRDFGGKDHTTIIHAVDKITSNLDKNKSLKKELSDLERKIRA